MWLIKNRLKIHNLQSNLITTLFFWKNINTIHIESNIMKHI